MSLSLPLLSPRLLITKCCWPRYNVIWSVMRGLDFAWPGASVSTYSLIPDSNSHFSTSSKRAELKLRPVEEQERAAKRSQVYRATYRQSRLPSIGVFR
ncbi:hypothetical protein B0H14DRAFT_3436661 [Mycena olivaceomarginata]|nr:hypothetical protein B0H14DRAFT_3436661 [Mycena olivaceomarginata]